MEPENHSGEMEPENHSGEGERVDDTNPESRKVVEELDEAVAILAAEHLAGDDA